MIDGLLIGHWTDRAAGTGCTVFVPPAGSVCAAEVRGQASGTREIAALEPAGSIETAHAIVLAGGSAFGLAAADGVARALAERGVGVPTRVAPVPIVAAAVVYDLALGPVAAPDADAGRAALAAAAPWRRAARGTVGAGTGATVGSLEGPDGWMKGGFGAAHRTLADGTTVAAWAVANALGDVIGEDGEVLAGLRRGLARPRVEEVLMTSPPDRPPLGEATTLAVVATDARLDKRSTWRIARSAHSGIARATAPAATSYDGDTAFAITTGARAARSFLAIESAAALLVASAIRDAVRNAGTLHGCPSLNRV